VSCGPIVPSLLKHKWPLYCKQSLGQKESGRITTRSIPELVPSEILQGDFDDIEIKGFYTSDLLSDVLANGRDATVLITIQAHKNTVAVATVADISLIVLCNDRPVIDDMIEAAAKARIGVIRTALSQFEVSGRLWQAMRPPKSGQP